MDYMERPIAAFYQIGLAPNTDVTWQLLLSKHPSCPLPTAPLMPSESTVLGPDFNIMATLQSFPLGTAAGTSGLHIQHLLDAAGIPLPIRICSLLMVVVNLLASGKAAPSNSKFLAGGSSTALNKERKKDAPQT